MTAREISRDELIWRLAMQGTPLAESIAIADAATEPKVNEDGRLSMRLPADLTGWRMYTGTVKE